ncbi:ATP-binding protein [Nanoarchaeota archaeon]
MNTAQLEQTTKDTIRKYKLFTKKDKILVACSGGKDSTAVLFILHKLGYNVEAIHVDPTIKKFSEIHIANLKKFCSKHQIKLHILSFKQEFGYSLCYIRSILNSKGIKLKSCTICGVLRRYVLNKHVRELGATKIVTGHNLDDEAQSVMMNFFRGNMELSARLGPETGLIKDKRFVPRVKPFYFVPENAIEAYSKKHNFPVKYGACPCRVGAYRKEVADVLDNLPDKTKLTIVNNLIKQLPLLKKKFKTTKQPNKCKHCTEPSKKELCQACTIIKLLRK